MLPTGTQLKTLHKGQQSSPVAWLQGEMGGEAWGRWLGAWHRSPFQALCLLPLGQWHS